MDEADFTDSRGTAAAARITSSNFRLLHRIFITECIPRIPDLTDISEDRTPFKGEHHAHRSVIWDCSDRLLPAASTELAKESRRSRCTTGGMKKPAIHPLANAQAADRLQAVLDLIDAHKQKMVTACGSARGIEL